MATCPTLQSQHRNRHLQTVHTRRAVQGASGAAVKPTAPADAARRSAFVHAGTTIGRALNASAQQRRRAACRDCAVRYPGEPAEWSHITSAGPFNSQTTPVSPNSIRASPWTAAWAKSTITVWPKPLRVGGDTAGPPVSRQEILKKGISRLSSMPQLTSTRPSLLDRAPYLAAFVASS